MYSSGLPLVAIDRPVLPSVLDLFIVITRTDQAVNINSRDAFQAKHDRVGTDKAIQAEMIGA